MTPRAHQILRLMLEIEEAYASVREGEPEPNDGYGAEIVVEGREAWLGMERLSIRTVTQLLRLMALSEADGCHPRTPRYVLNGTGRALARRASLAQEIEAAIATGRNFTITEGAIAFL